MIRRQGAEQGDIQRNLTTLVHERYTVHITGKVEVRVDVQWAALFAPL